MNYIGTEKWSNGPTHQDTDSELDNDADPNSNDYGLNWEIVKDYKEEFPKDKPYEQCIYTFLMVRPFSLTPPIEEPVEEDVGE